MPPSILSTLLLGSTLIAASSAQTLIDPELVGTWTTKSKAVLTGPGFYNPVTDKITEPNHPGISYSFTADGFYEEAYFRAVSNPTQPECPSAILQWQHGTYTIETNGSLIMKPFEVDGRQVMSSPCSYDQSVYTRYKQPELMERYEVRTDTFHNVKRLNLFQFDGQPVHPMFLAYSPPQMLPTSTLNPTPTATASGASPTKTAKVKRGIERRSVGQVDISHQHTIVSPHSSFNADRWWWVGVGLTALGSVLYMYPSS